MKVQSGNGFMVQRGKTGEAPIRLPGAWSIVHGLLVALIVLGAFTMVRAQEGARPVGTTELSALDTDLIVKELLLRQARSAEKLPESLSLMTDSARRSEAVRLRAMSPKRLLKSARESPLRHYSASQLLAVLDKRMKIVYGNDDRVDLRVLEKRRDQFIELGIRTDRLDQILSNARSVASVLDKGRVAEIPGEDRSLIITGTYGAPMDLCRTEAFYGQPTASFCTAFFVGKDIVVTAGHCVDETDVKNSRFLFDFRMPRDGNHPETLIVENDRIYRGVELLGRELTQNGPDWAVVRVDRPIADRPALRIRTSGKIDEGTDVYVIGHPSGLPAKFADGAIVRDNSNDDFFVSNLDTYGGNSGSPVFNRNTHEVEGILVRGGQDFELLRNDDLECVQTVYAGDEEGRGEDVTRTAVFASIVTGGDIE